MIKTVNIVSPSKAKNIRYNMLLTGTFDIADDNLCISPVKNFKEKNTTIESSINKSKNNDFSNLYSSYSKFPVKTEPSSKRNQFNNYKVPSKINNSTSQLKKQLYRTENIFRSIVKSNKKTNIVPDKINSNKKTYIIKNHENKWNKAENKNSSSNLLLLNSTLNSSKYSSSNSCNKYLSSNQIMSYSHKLLKNTKKNLCDIYFKCLADIKDFENLKQTQENSLKNVKNNNIKKIDETLKKIDFMGQLFQENKNKNLSNNENKILSYDIKKNNNIKSMKKNLKRNYNLVMTAISQNIYDKKKLIKKFEIYQNKNDRLLNYETFIKKMKENNKLILTSKNEKKLSIKQVKLPKIMEKTQI